MGYRAVCYHEPIIELCVWKCLLSVQVIISTGHSHHQSKGQRVHLAVYLICDQNQKGIKRSRQSSNQVCFTSTIKWSKAFSVRHPRFCTLLHILTNSSTRPHKITTVFIYTRNTSSHFDPSHRSKYRSYWYHCPLSKPVCCLLSVKFITSPKILLNSYYVIWIKHYSSVFLLTQCDSWSQGLTPWYYMYGMQLCICSLIDTMVGAVPHPHHCNKHQQLQCSNTVQSYWPCGGRS